MSGVSWPYVAALFPTRNEWPDGLPPTGCRCHRHSATRDVTPHRLAKSTVAWPILWTIAAIERRGIPMDTGTLQAFRERWDAIKAGLIHSVDPDSLVYVDGVFGRERWSNLLARHHIPWPRDPMTGRLLLDDDTFRQQAKAHPKVVAPYHELRATLSRLKLNSLAVGSDGRNRTMLSPFGSATGRNQPSNSKFIFGPSTWIRGLIKPSEGRTNANIDWAQQELGIAAALSGDEKMMNAYTSGDPYLTLAKMAGAVPEAATRQTHPAERAAYKVCMLAVQYGMGAKSLADQLGDITLNAKRLLQAHKDTFNQYWRWSERVQNRGVPVSANCRPASAGNGTWPPSTSPPRFGTFRFRATAQKCSGSH